MLLLQTQDIFSISLFALHYTSRSQTSIYPSQRFTRCYLTYASAFAKRTGEFQQSHAYQWESGRDLKLEGQFFFKHLCAHRIFPKQNTVEDVRTERCLFKCCSFCQQKHKYSQKKEKKWSELLSDFSILQLMEMCEQMYFLIQLFFIILICWGVSTVLGLLMQYWVTQIGFVESYKIFKLWGSLSTNLRQTTSAKDCMFS